MKCIKHETKEVTEFCSVMSCENVLMCNECMKEEPEHLKHHKGFIHDIEIVYEWAHSGVFN